MNEWFDIWMYESQSYTVKSNQFPELKKNKEICKLFTIKKLVKLT